MKKSLHKRLLSLLLVLTMMVSFSPAVFAEAGDEAGYDTDIEISGESEPVVDPEPAGDPEPVIAPEPTGDPEPGDDELDPAGETEPEESEDEQEEDSQDETPVSPVLLYVVSTQALQFSLSDESGLIAPATEEEIAACLAALSAAQADGTGVPELSADAAAEAQPETYTKPEIAAGDTAEAGPAADETAPAEILFRSSYLLTQGTYTWTAEAEGFIPAAESFSVTEETPWGYTLTVTLEENKLPFGFKGMPEGYELSEDELAAKQALIDHDVLKTLESLTPGADYVEGEILFSADSREYAETVAEAYCADLTGFHGFFAVAQLREATTLEAVTAASDMKVPLPAVEANHLGQMEPVYAGAPQPKAFMSNGMDSGEAAPQKMSWEAWRDYVKGKNGQALGMVMDPYLEDPTSSNYQWMHDMVNTYEAWGVTRGAGVPVAVIDTGVDAGHEDLGGAVADMGIPFSGYNAAHGTHVAGIVGARVANGVGGAGIAPEATIYSYNVFGDSETYEYADLAAAIRAAADNGAWIINMSLGGWFYSGVVETALEYAIYDENVTVVVSMGNNSSNVKSYPAAYNIPGLIAVGSVAESGARSTFSSYGSWQDVAAPGSNIWSTIPGDYACYNGTSMAAPVVAGACALYMSYYGHVSPSAMESAVKAATTNGILDASKFFAGKKDIEAPVIGFYNNAQGGELQPVGGKIPYGSFLQLSTENPTDDEFIIYTVNGKNPAVKNGVVSEGTLYSSAALEDGVPITREYGFKIGSKFTIKAARVNGLGVISKVSSKTVTVDYADPGEVEITTLPLYVTAGKSYTFRAGVHPAESTFPGTDVEITDADVRQTATWHIDWDSVSGIPNNGKTTINQKTGVLKTAAGTEGKLYIYAEVNGLRSASHEVQVITLTTKRIVLEAGPSTLYLGGTNDTLPGGTALAPVAYSADGTPLVVDQEESQISLVGFSYSSSNKKVLTVDAEGNITAVGKGKATVTVKALDGSNVAVKRNFTVVQLVTNLSISGPKYVAPGKSSTYKVSVTPSSANNKGVTWSLIDAPEGVSINSKGKLTVAKSLTIPDGPIEFTLLATAKDQGQLVSEPYTVTIQPAAQSVLIYADESYSNLLPQRFRDNNKNGSLKQATLFRLQPDYWTTYELPDGSFTEDLSTYDCVGMKLAADVSVPGDTVYLDGLVTWSSSNPKVATVDEDGNITAHAVGSATITAKLNDQSGKKATTVIRVINPASSVTVRSGSASAYGDTSRLLAVGKSVTNKAVLGDTFGKPTVTKVKWDYEVFACKRDVDYNAARENPEAEDYRIDDDNVEKLVERLVSVNGSGKLTVKNNADLRSYAEQYHIEISVYAETQEDKGLQRGYCTYLLTRPISWVGAGSYFIFDENGNQISHKISNNPKTTMTVNAGTRNNIWVPLGIDFVSSYEVERLPYIDFVVSSSNPNVAGAMVEMYHPDPDGGSEDKPTGGYADDLTGWGVRIITSPNKTGTAKITVKAADGSGKKATITVKVR